MKDFLLGGLLGLTCVGVVYAVAASRPAVKLANPAEPSFAVGQCVAFFDEHAESWESPLHDVRKITQIGKHSYKTQSFNGLEWIDSILNIEFYAAKNYRLVPCK